MEIGMCAQKYLICATSSKQILGGTKRENLACLNDLLKAEVISEKAQFAEAQLCIKHPVLRAVKSKNTELTKNMPLSTKNSNIYNVKVLETQCSG